MAVTVDRGELFRRLHQSGCFVIPFSEINDSFDPE